MYKYTWSRCLKSRPGFNYISSLQSHVFPEFLRLWFWKPPCLFNDINLEHCGNILRHLICWPTNIHHCTLHVSKRGFNQCMVSKTATISFVSTNIWSLRQQQYLSQCNLAYSKYQDMYIMADSTNTSNCVWQGCLCCGGHNLTQNHIIDLSWHVTQSWCSIVYADCFLTFKVPKEWTRNEIW